MTDGAPAALLAALAALAARDYPEIGVPTLLVCDGDGTQAISVDLDKLAAELAALARVLATARPTFGVADIGQLMEHHADCYFFDLVSPRFSTNTALHPLPQR